MDKPDLRTYTFRDDLIDGILDMARDARLDLSGSEADARMALHALSDDALLMMERSVQERYRDWILRRSRSLDAPGQSTSERPPFSPHYSRFSRQYIWERSG